MTNYQTLDGTQHNDFRYNTEGMYHNTVSAPRPLRRKAIKHESGPGKVCVGCGITRSRSNKCTCNS